MKGIVFTNFNEMIEEKFGLEVWDRLVDSTCPESEGVYTTGDMYADDELFAYVGELSRITGVGVDDLVVAFGEHLMQQFAGTHPEYLEGHTAKSFLRSVHDVVHVDVRKLYPGASTPQFTYEDASENELTMIYRSSRKLCRLAEGLINGVSNIFHTPINHSQMQCMHNGDDHCRFELKFGKANAHGG